MGIDYDAELIVGIKIKKSSINVKSVIRTTPPKYATRKSLRKRTNATNNERENSSDSESQEDDDDFDGNLNEWLFKHFPKFQIVMVSDCQCNSTDYYLAYIMENSWEGGVEWSTAFEHFQNVDVNEFAHVYQCLTGIADMSPKVYSVASVS